MKLLSKIKKTEGERTWLKWLISSLFWLFLLFLGFVLNDYYDNIIAKPGINIIMPETYNSLGIFEITLVNGPIELTNIKIRIKSPTMNNTWKVYFPDDLPKNQKYIINFLDEKTLNNSKKIDCINHPFDNLDNGRAKMIIYRNKTSNETILPQNQTSIFYACGYGYWTIEISSDQINETFTKTTYLPLQYRVETNLGDQIDINSPDIVYDSEILISCYDNRAWEIAELA
ncbi:MAG: hypothetical protein AABX17_01390 [Nanoarchaeota archaeon]